MPREPIPPEHLEPLLRDGWQGRDRAWALLVEHGGAIRAAVTAVWRTVDPRTRSRNDGGFEDLVSETLLSMMRRATNDEGLARPEDWTDRADAFPWLYRVAWTHADTLARKVRRVGAMERPAPAPGEKGALPEPHSLSNPEREVVDAEATQRLQTLLDHPDLKPAHKLVIVLRFFPQHLDVDLVERVAAASDPTQGWGLARPPAETAALLRRWLDHPPADDVAASRTLAWILRSSDTAGPEPWRRAHPDDMARALDLVRQWRNRALKHVGATS